MGTSFKMRFSLGLLIAAASSSAAAQPYIGAALGQTKYLDADHFGVGRESITFEIHGGFRLQEALALEMSYLSLGDVRYDYIGSDVNVSGVTLSGKAILPLGPQMDLYAKMGMYFWEMDAIHHDHTHLIEEGEDWIYGGGLTLHLNNQLDLNLEYRALDLYDMGTSLTTVGVSFLF